MATNTNVKFYLGSAPATGSQAAGGIYFDQNNHVIYVGGKEIVRNFDPSNYATITAVTDGITAATAAVMASVVNGISGSSAISVTGTTQVTISAKLSTATGNNLTIKNDGLFLSIPAATDYTLTATSSTAVEGIAKRYTLSQTGVSGAQDIVIDIPKDMVVSSGQVVTDPTGQPAGTYIELTLANATNDKIYINAANLIEYVTSGSATGDMVQIAVSNDHKVTASIKSHSITTAELADGVTASLGRADSALQGVDTTTAGTKVKVTLGQTGKNVTVSVDETALSTELGKKLNTTAAETWTVNGKSFGTGHAVTITGGDIKIGGSDTSTIADAISAASTAGVTSFGGKTGAIALKATSNTNGAVNLSMTGNTLQASIVGLQSAAYATAGAFDAAGSANNVLSTVNAYTINGYTLGSAEIALTGGDIKVSGSTTTTLVEAISAAAGSGVTSFGTKTGAIIVRGDLTGNGDVNLTMNGNKLQASIVGLGNAAFTDTAAYATSTQGGYADTAIQGVTGSGDIVCSVAGGTGEKQVTVSLVWESYSA